MREKILNELIKLSREERAFVTAGAENKEQEFYSRSGRFIIDRRRISDISSGDPTVSIGLRTHPSGGPFPEHMHNFIELMFVYRGRITHVIENKRITLEEGDIIILGRSTSHSIETTSENEIGVNLIISCDLLESILSDMRKESTLATSELQELLDVKSGRYLLFPTSHDENVSGLMDNIISSYVLSESINEYILRTSLSLLICYLSSYLESLSPFSGKDIKTRLLNYVSTSYSTATLAEAADFFGLSVPYLSRWIAKNIGKTFKELLMNERFSAACELLSETEMPISDIIRTVGYENSSYFHKEFKKRFEITPHEYRKKNTNR